MFPPSCTQTNIHTFAPHVDTQKWTRYPHSHSPYALYTPRSRHHHPQRGSQRPIPELNPLRSGVGTGRPPRSPQQQRKSTAQTPTISKLDDVVGAELGSVVIGQQREEQRAEHTALWGTCAQCGSARGVVADTD